MTTSRLFDRILQQWSVLSSIPTGGKHTYSLDVSSGNFYVHEKGSLSNSAYKHVFSGDNRNTMLNHVDSLLTETEEAVMILFDSLMDVRNLECIGKIRPTPNKTQKQHKKEPDSPKSKEAEVEIIPVDIPPLKVDEFSDAISRHKRMQIIRQRIRLLTGIIQKVTGGKTGLERTISSYNRDPEYPGRLERTTSKINAFISDQTAQIQELVKLGFPNIEMTT